MANVFVVDCPRCKAKVGVEEKGRILRKYWIDEAQEPGVTYCKLVNVPDARPRLSDERFRQPSMAMREM